MKKKETWRTGCSILQIRAGAIAGSIVPGIGTTIGAVLGAAYGLFKSYGKDAKKATKAFDQGTMGTGALFQNFGRGTPATTKSNSSSFDQAAKPVQSPLVKSRFHQ